LYKKVVQHTGLFDFILEFWKLSISNSTISILKLVMSLMPAFNHIINLVLLTIGFRGVVFEEK